jgi:hypothetical protein
MIEPLKSVFCIVVPEPSKRAPAIMTLLKCTPLTWPLLKAALVRSAPRTLAGFRPFCPSRVAPMKLTPRKVAPEKIVAVSMEELSVASVKSAP